MNIQVAGHDHKAEHQLCAQAVKAHMSACKQSCTAFCHVFDFALICTQAWRLRQCRLIAIGLCTKKISVSDEKNMKDLLQFRVFCLSAGLSLISHRGLNRYHYTHLCH